MDTDLIVIPDEEQRRAEKPVGTCPACKQPVYNSMEKDGPVWVCPADLSKSNPYWQPSHPKITEELQEKEGIFSNCGEDFGFLPCHEQMPLHSKCYEKGEY